MTNKEMTSAPQSLVIGTYTEKLPHVDGHARGILSATFDGNSVSAPTVEAELQNPSWVTTTEDGRSLYAVVETVEFEGKPGGGVAAYARDVASGRLTLLNTVSSGGPEPAHLAVDPSGRFVLVANYGGGSVFVYERKSDGSLGELASSVHLEGSGANPARQEAPHAHQVLFDPVTGDLLVADLGTDTVTVYRLSEAGKLTERPEARIKTALGAGPRHLAFHPDGQHLFLVNELNSTLVVFRRNGDRLDQTQVVSTLPEGFAGHNQASEVRVSASGRHVLAANRGHNSVVVLEFDAATSTLKLKLVEPSRGIQPRDFVLSPGGRHIVVGNQDSDTVVVFAFDENVPSLTFVSQTEVPTPVCLRFVA